MAAFFGIDEFKAQGFIDKSVVCIPHDDDGRLDLHAIVAPIKNGDIVFIKQCTPLLELHIKAIGIVQSDYPTEGILGICLPVNWVWQGERVPFNVDDTSALCGAALYEEHSISVQKEIMDLLPEKCRMPQEW